MGHHASRLDQPSLTQLRKLLAALFPTELDQRRIATDAGLTIAAIALGSSAFNNWHQILHYANHNAKVGALLRLAREEYPDNEGLRAFAEGRPVPIIEGAAFDWETRSPGKSLLEKLVSGRESLVHVAHLAMGVERARAVAKVVRGDAGVGTAFLIEGERLLTNHHVLPTAEIATDGHAIFNYQRSRFGHDEAIETLGLRPESFFRTCAEDDWTVVAVDGAPCQRWGFVSSRCSCRAINGERPT